MKKLLVFMFGLLFALQSFATGIDSGTTSADCDSATFGQTSGTVNLEMDWQPNTVNIRWYDGENQLSVPTNAKTCSYGGALYLPTAPTKKGYTFEGWEVKYAIPEEYTELEYVHFDGTSTTGAYVNTGLNFYTNVQNTKARFVADAKVYQGSDWQVIVGNLGVLAAYIGSNRDNLFYYAVGSKDTSTSVYNPYVKCHFDLDSVAGTYKITNLNTNAQIVNISNISAVSQQNTLPIYLGGFNDGRTAGMRPARTNMDLYSIEIYNDNILVFKGVPVRRNSDSVVGIYDTISGTFKINANGTNALIAGPVVQ